jgi:2-polyprenyl-6-methoxyphenol hydroxylase-like FAD-dependent oxidoreductase
MHVIIVGGGTGGMCLAHGLRRAGISVAVYERYRSRSEGLHGYRVGIDPNTALRDAALLCRALTAAARGEKTILDAIAAYEAEMIPYRET